MMAAILPVFWLAALMYGPLAVSAAADFTDNTAHSAADQAAPGSEHPGGPGDEYVRCELRRISLQPLPAAQPRQEPAGAAQPVLRHSLALATPLTGEAFSLQQRWQFVWRTADSPRAPTRCA